MRLPRVLLRVLLVLLACLAVLRASGAERGTVGVLLVGLLPLVLLPAYPALLVGVLRRDRVTTGLALALVAAHLLVVAPAVTASPLAAGARSWPRLRVVVANLYVLNREPEATGTALRALHADVLVVPELDARGLAGLRASGLLDDLPYDVVDRDAAQETVGLLSRLPLLDVDVERANGRVLPRAGVDVGGVRVRLLAAHVLPPVWVLERRWRRTLTALADEARATPGPAVVLGDLNADRDHRAFRRLLDAGLRDAADERGRGLSSTWPAGAAFERLDHVLVRDGSGRLAVLAVRTVRLPGTDHLAVVADVAVGRR